MNKHQAGTGRKDAPCQEMGLKLSAYMGSNHPKLMLDFTMQSSHLGLIFIFIDYLHALHSSVFTRGNLRLQSLCLSSSQKAQTPS